MKKGLVCGLVALMLLCGCGQQTMGTETVGVKAVVNEARGSTSAQSGKVVANRNKKAKQTSNQAKNASTSVKNKVGEKKWDVKKEIKSYTRNGKKIYGEIYRPVGDGQFPGIIIAHGLNCSCDSYRDVARFYAQNGVVAYIFEFIGGSTYSKSGGSMTDMSVLTEAADFNVVFNAIRSLSYVDDNRMFIMGESLGGYVATYIAGTRPKDVKGLIALYPAYNLPGQELKSMLRFIPSGMELFGFVLGYRFFEDLTKVDIYKVMANYTGKTVIIHGTQDMVVPISYSEQAVKTMKNAKLVKVNGGQHEFGGIPTVRSEALKLMKEIANK